MERIEELQRELARKELVASTIEDNQSVKKKNIGDELFSVRSDSIEDNKNKTQPLNSVANSSPSPDKRDNFLSPRYQNVPNMKNFNDNKLEELK